MIYSQPTRHARNRNQINACCSGLYVAKATEHPTHSNQAAYAGAVVPNRFGAATLYEVDSPHLGIEIGSPDPLRGPRTTASWEAQRLRLELTKCRCSGAYLVLACALIGASQRNCGIFCTRCGCAPLTLKEVELEQ